jgi:hypothetical protein
MSPRARSAPPHPAVAPRPCTATCASTTPRTMRSASSSRRTSRSNSGGAPRRRPCARRVRSRRFSGRGARQRMPPRHARTRSSDAAIGDSLGRERGDAVSGECAWGHAPVDRLPR